MAMAARGDDCCAEMTVGGRGWRWLGVGMTCHSGENRVRSVRPNGELPLRGSLQFGQVCNLPLPSARPLRVAKGRGNGVVCFSLDSRVRGNDGWFLSLELEYYQTAMV